MTNEEINRRVAEIEGWVCVGDVDCPDGWQHETHCQESGGYYLVPGWSNVVSATPPPYATDWAWCGPLLEKGEISVWPADGRWWARAARPATTSMKAGATALQAVCLAYIAAHAP